MIALFSGGYRQPLSEIGPIIHREQAQRMGIAGCNFAPNYNEAIMKTTAMNIIELSHEQFQQDFRRLFRENPGAEVRITEGGRAIARLMIPNGHKPTGLLEGAKLIGEGPTAAEYVSAQRD